MVLPANTLASRQVLIKAALGVNKPDQFQVLPQDGDRIRRVFLMDLGAAGVVI